ncbi:hypothetical protein [Beijerinckia sp. L45]|uniref:hypothetical protein n=1 Tax=Beijerinckia sp. L45 TaxID=1641855 RepID=UPI00131C49DD|nr:hypothetical protein [Beijerinckia sp. L45]
MIRAKHESTPPRRDDPSDDDMQRAARCAVVHRIKTRARLYAKRPMALEPLYPGLACASGATLVAVASHLVERESRSPRRWFGFGGEVSLVNAKAALLLGRANRRFGSRG